MQIHSIRVLIGKLGLDGHDRGAVVVARGLRECGMDVRYTGIRKTPSQLASLAEVYQPNAIGLSFMTGTHMEHTRMLLQELSARRLPDIPILIGGIIPEAHIPALLQLGVKAVFTPGSSIASIAAVIRAHVQQKTDGVIAPSPHPARPQILAWRDHSLI